MIRSGASAWLLFLLIFVGCTQYDLETPLPRTVLIQMQPQPASVTKLWRYAVVWTVPKARPGFIVTIDRPVPQDSSELPITFELPTDDILDVVEPVGRLELSRRTPVVAIHRPRVVLYADRDRNRRFEPNAFGVAGPDEIVGIDSDSAGIAAILDLEGTLRNLPLDESEALYVATEGRFTPFVFVAGTAVLGVPSEGRAPLELGSERAQASFECLRSVTEAYGISQRSVVVDEELHQELCALEASDCVKRDLSSLEAPDLTRGSVQCRRTGELVSLVVRLSAWTCDDCRCSYASGTRAVVAEAGREPSWWPCGDARPYCESAQPITEWATDCQLAEAA